MLSPTARPPSAWPSKSSAVISAAWRRAALGVDAALDDAEQRLAGRARRRAAARRPRGGARQRDLVDLAAPRRRAGTGRSTSRCPSRARAWMLHRDLGRQPVLAAVDVRAERDAVVVDLVDRGEREHLEAAGVGEDRPVPRGEPVQPARGLHHLEPGPQVQVIRVAEDDPRVERRRAQLVGGHRLDRPERADRHEHRRRDVAARRVQDAGARVAQRREQLEREAGGGEVELHERAVIAAGGPRESRSAADMANIDDDLASQTTGDMAFRNALGSMVVSGWVWVAGSMSVE